MEKQNHPKKIVLMFGMIGAGKSTVANTILGRQAFLSGSSAKSITR